jgi:hypothetical protein
MQGAQPLERLYERPGLLFHGLPAGHIARAVDTETGQLTFTESAGGLSEARVVSDAHGAVISGALDTDAEFAKATAQAALSLSERLGQQFPVVGTVVSSDGDDLVTDLERLRHPVTGEAVGWKKNILGLARVSAVDRASSVAHVVLRSRPGERIQVGDVAVVRPRE